MGYLKMALEALESMEAATTERGDRDHTPPAKVANLHPVETPQASPQECILTCFECGYFRPANRSPNTIQAFGRCEKRKKGRYGCATACEAALEVKP